MSGELPSARNDKGYGAGLALALAVFSLCVWHSLFLIDDAFISFRYARHWAEGLGLVYNVGTSPPVEGYSNFSWVALLAAGLRLGLPLEVFAHVLSVGSGAATIVLLHRCLRYRFKFDALVCTLACVTLAALPGFHFWASGGLETSFFGLLLFAFWAGACANDKPPSLARAVGLGLFGGLIVLTRPEGLVWIGGLWLAAWVARGKDRFLPRAALPIIITLSLALLHLLWRHNYYGEWLPNTVHAKSSTSMATLGRGGRTLGSWAITFVWPVLVLAAPFFAAPGKQRRLTLAAFTMVGGGLAYNLVVGGDWMPFFRFMAPLAAFFAIGLAVCLARLPKPAAGLATLGCVIVAGLPAFDLAVAPRSLRETLYFRKFRTGYQTEWQRWQTAIRNTERNTWLGLGLKQVLPPESSWTGGAIGAVGYYSDLPILGRNGLVHRGVARREVGVGGGTAGHEKRVPRVYFRDQSPTFYDALIFASAVPPSGPAFDQAVGGVYQSFLTDPLEQGLLSSSYVEARAIQDIPGLVQPATLLLLMHTDDANKARAFWARYRR